MTGVDIPLAAFDFEIGEPFLYQYNLLIPWEIDCRIEATGHRQDTVTRPKTVSRRRFLISLMRSRPWQCSHTLAAPLCSSTWD